MTRYFDGKYAVQPDFDTFLQRYDFARLQFLAGCGFESRSPAMLQLLAQKLSRRAKIEITVVDLQNRRDPSYTKARTLQNRNMANMRSLAQDRKWLFRRISADLYSRRLVAHRPLLKILRAIIRRFSGDFLVDISSLPRSIVFPALRMLWRSHQSENLFVAYTEDREVGALEKQAKAFRNPSFIPFFGSRVKRRFRVWLPILGSDPRPIDMIADQYHFDDIFPVVGFPSSFPIETDEIVRRNQKIISKRTEKVVFASMNDPFQLSTKLNSMIDEIQGSLGGDVTFVISPHGSKPQSVGALITAITRRTALLYCQPYSYVPRRGATGRSRLYWLKGFAYSG